VPQDDLTALAHVIWIGGSPCAGKTSVAQQLADRHSLQAYHFDRHEADHIKRSSPARHPALHTFLAMTLDERWVLRSP
jgi:adenylylsulfate kinase-like enzyme